MEKKSSPPARALAADSSARISAIATATDQSPTQVKPKSKSRKKDEDAVLDLKQRIPDIERLFNVHGRIGNGTFSSVLLGTVKSEQMIPFENRRKFAIKHHIPTSHPDRIIRELRCLIDIGGVDNVVGINCTIRHNESVAFIMPYLPHDRFNDFYNKMELDEAQFYMKNLLVALRRVHKFNVIHRDVKPSNFLYNRRHRKFLLVDFGLAQHIKAQKAQKRKCEDVTSTTATDLKRRRESTVDPNLIKEAETPKMPLKQINAKPSTSSAANSNQNSSTSTAAAQSPPKCNCWGKPQVCNLCLVRKELHAARAGTPGYRPPEVLIKYREQTTAVDLWAAGVIFLCILSGVYPFFKAPNDFVALAEMVAIFGDAAIRKTAMKLDRLITLSQKTTPLDLRKLCVRFRNSKICTAAEVVRKYERDGKCEICPNCDQYCFNCVCVDCQYTTEPLGFDKYPDCAYDLLTRLLDLNPHTRISAEEALKHPFFQMDFSAV